MTAMPTSASTASTPATSVTDLLLFPWMIELVGVFVLFILTRWNLPFPYAAVIFIIGAICGTGGVRRMISTSQEEGQGDGNINAGEEEGHHITQFIDIFFSSVDTWSKMNGSLLLLVFLPGLIFADAISTDFELFKLALGQVLILAFPMVFVGTMLTGMVCYYLLPYDWTVGQVLTLGAILASTDPIAVSSVLKTAGASPRLVMHISGESLLNDGSSVVFFTIFSNLAFYELGLEGSSPIFFWESAMLFFQMAIGGCIVGCLFGAFLITLLCMLDEYLEPHMDILQVVAAMCTAYLSYYVSDEFLKMSGVVACVSCGIVAQGYGKGMINDTKLMKTHLELLEHLLNTLLFALGGVIWAEVSFQNQEKYSIQLHDWCWLGLLYVMILAIRFVQVFSVFPFFSNIGLQSNKAESIFLAYGGLRGSVGVALGLSFVRHIYNSTSDPVVRELATMVQFMGGGVTFLTLTINGTTAGHVLKLLGLAKPPESRKRALTIFEGLSRDFVNEQCQKLMQEPRFDLVNFNVLRDYVPFLTKELSSSARNSTDVGTSPPFLKRASTGEQFLRIVGASSRYLQRGDDSDNFSYVHSTKEEEEALLKEIRTVFLELLKEAYQTLVELGEVDEKEDNGHMLDILHQSVDLSLNSIEHDDYHALDDWNYLLLFRVQQQQTIADDHRRKRRRTTIFHTLNWPIRFYRNDVLIPLIFSEAHHLAEAKLQSYMNRMDIENSEDAQTVNKAVEAVVRESQREVRKASDSLKNEVDKAVLEIVISHYCARILLRRFIRFLDHKAKEGVLQRSEARLFRREAEAQVEKVITDSMDKIEAQLFSETPSDCLEEVPINHEGMSLLPRTSN